MTFEENPFRVLQVSIYDTKATINERADELSFEDPDREEIFEQARTVLLNPKKRIAAEVWYLVGEDIFRDMNIYRLAVIDEKFSAQNPKTICKQINSARAKSKFPTVQDTAEIKAELKNIRYEIREKFQAGFKNMTRDGQIRLANVLADKLIEDEEDFGVIIEDFFDSYRLEMTPLFEETTGRVIILLNTIKFNPNANFPDELNHLVKSFSDTIKPLDKMSIAVGTNNFDESEEFFYEVRDVAIKLFNEKDLIDVSLRITRMLEEKFSYLPTLSETIREDIKFLEETKARRPTQSFLEAKAALDNIQAAIDKNLYFKKGFEQANLSFYEKIFKPGLVFDLIRIANNTTCKPIELKILKARAATIYIIVGNAMTWARRADFALDCFQKALPYAKDSGDAELISLAQKRIDEWRTINEQIAANSNENSSGCFWWIVAIIVLILLTR